MKNTLCVLLAALFIFASCKNAMINEMLMDIAILNNINIVTVDDKGESTDVNYGLVPAFSSRSMEYTMVIPQNARKMTVTGIPHTRETIRYHLGYKGQDKTRDPEGTLYPDVFAAREIDSDNGLFDLDPLIKYFSLTLMVNREGRFETVYTIQLVRMNAVWITRIDIKTWSAEDPDDPASVAAAALGSYNWPLTPGFTPIVQDYRAGVNTNAVKLQIVPVKRAQLSGASSNAGISFEFPDADGPARAPVPPGEGAVYDFPISERTKTIRIIVRNPDEDPDPLEYSLTIIRPGRVLAAAGKEHNFVISGASDHYFSEGEQVFFSVMPPFGYTAAPGSVTALSNGTNLPLVSTRDGYVFKMPIDTVTLHAEFDEVPPAADANVRYVYEKGTGDGSTWARATNDLQSLIDAFDPVTNNYEIWIAAGKIHPIWAWTDKPKSAWPDWAGGLPQDQLVNENKCFVLKNGIRIYGGFSDKGTEKNQADRDKRPYRNTANGIDVQINSQTILSGEPDSTRHLVLALNITRPTLVEGLHIAESKAGGQSATLIINGVSLGGKTWYGAGLYAANCTRDLVFSHVTFRDNYTSYGAGAYVYNASPSFEDCAFRGNMTSTMGGGVFIQGASAPYFERCNFSNNYCPYGSGSSIRAYDASTALVLKDTNFFNNHGTNIFASGSIYMEGGEITDNSGNGITVYTDANEKSAVLTNVRITNNYGTGLGMGVSFRGTSNSVLAMTNVEITGSKAYQVGAVYVGSGSKVFLTNVTIAGNYADDPANSWTPKSGGILFNVPPAAGSRIVNSIIHGNRTASSDLNIGDDRPDFSSSIVGGITGDGIIEREPLFTPYYYPTAQSPAVDAGDNGLYNSVYSAMVCAEKIVLNADGTASVPAPGALLLGPGPDRDLAGKQRIKGAKIDLGAYEF